MNLNLKEYRDEEFAKNQNFLSTWEHHVIILLMYTPTREILNPRNLSRIRYTNNGWFLIHGYVTLFYSFSRLVHLHHIALVLSQTAEKESRAGLTSK